jgi:hypothetical protein
VRLSGRTWVEEPLFGLLNSHTREISRSHRPSSKRAISVFRKTQSRTRLCHLESTLSQYQKPTTFGVSLQRSITRRKEYRQQLLSKPSTLSPTLSLNIDPTLQTREPATKVGSSENVREVLLAHASLYVVAEKWGVESLKMLTLSKRHQTLKMLDLDAPKVQDIVELTRYAYSDEITPDLQNGIDGLRELICHYIAANARMMAEYTTFTALIEDRGALIRDLWKLVTQFL